MAQIIKDIVTWLKQWFPTKEEVDTSLKPFNDRYNGVIVNTSGSTFPKQFYRLFRLQTDTGSAKNASLIFEIISLMNNGNYARIKVDIRQPSATTNNPNPSAVLYVFPLEVNNLNLSDLYFAFNSTYGNNYVDIFVKIGSIQNYLVRVYDGHSRDGSYTQFSPVKNGDENYESIESADLLINGGSTYDNPVKTGADFGFYLTADKFIKTGGTSSQFLKADGSVDSNSYLTTANASSTYVAKENGKGLFSGSYNDLTNKPAYTPTITSETSGAYEIGSIINLDGSNTNITIYGKDTNTNTIGYQLRTNSTSLTASDTTYRYRLVLETPDGKYMPVNTSTSTSATANKSNYMNVNQPFLLFGDIRYYYSTTVVNADSTFGTGNTWQQYNVNLGYSFNNTGSALTLTPNAPVYMVARQLTPYPSYGVLVAPYFTQTLPNTEDGLLYIKLGYATSATNMELTPHHQIYEFKNGDIRLFSLDTHTHNNILPSQIDGIHDWVVVKEKIDSKHDVQLYVNEALHMCYLRFHREITSAQQGVLYGGDNATTWTDFQAWVPNPYKPLFQVQGAINYLGTLIVNYNGTIMARFGEQLGAVDIYSSVMWFYQESQV